jgi:hypothetical protein
VVFRTIDDLMASKKLKMLDDPNCSYPDASLLEASALEYAKDDMTEYSKALGIANKKRGTAVGSKKKVKKGKKKKGKGKKQGITAKIPGAVHYDVDAEEGSAGDGQPAEIDNSLEDEESAELSLEEEDAPLRKSLFELQV